MYRVKVKQYIPPEFDIGEILRYMGIRENTSEYSDLVNSCIKECSDVIKYNVCYAFSRIKTANKIIEFDNFSVRSLSLSKLLYNCDSSIIFSATIGIGIDRLITKYSRILPSKAICFQAIGTERIEALCDMFCMDIKLEYGRITQRFSPGYGDLNISVQKEIFCLLNSYKNIGLTLNDSLIMSPSKSVTAIIGIERNL